MYFKAIFNPSLEEHSVEHLDLDIDPNMGVEVIRHDNHVFELDRNEFGEISSLTYSSQCINTYDIERAFINLLYNIITDEKRVRLIDSDGTEDLLDRDELLEYLT